MLGKLLKHEFKATWKLQCTLYLALIAISISSSLFGNIKTTNPVGQAFQGLLYAIFFIYIIVMIVVGNFILLARFYKHMFQDQGYLAHTLPVPTWQHIVVKVIVDVFWSICMMISVAVSLFIFALNKNILSSGEFKTMLIQVRDFIAQYPSLGKLICVVCIAFLFQMIYDYLLFFSAMSLGQLFNKHKVIGAIFFFFIVNFIVSYINDLLLTPVLEKQVETITTIAASSDAITTGCDQLITVMPVTILSIILWSAIYYCITHFMLTKKLNLE